MVELARLDDIDVVFTDLPPPPPFDDLLTLGNVECVLAGIDTDNA
jgi:DeoR family glycerol-3-phosphate regulon repressor